MSDTPTSQGRTRWKCWRLQTCLAVQASLEAEHERLVARRAALREGVLTQHLPLVAEDGANLRAPTVLNTNFQTQGAVRFVTPQPLRRGKRFCPGIANTKVPPNERV